MGKEYIRLTNVLSEMDQLDDSGKPSKFQMKFVTANRIAKAGGRIIEVCGARKCVGVRDGEIITDTRKHKPAEKVSTIPKDPNHWKNATRNILLANGQMRKVHIRLIIEFNHQKVCF